MASLRSTARIARTADAVWKQITLDSLADMIGPSIGGGGHGRTARLEASR